jgi:hypothetical protein
MDLAPHTATTTVLDVPAAGAMMFWAQPGSRMNSGLLVQAMRAGVRGFDGFLSPAQTTGLCADPGKVTGLRHDFISPGPRPPILVRSDAGSNGFFRGHIMDTNCCFG